MKFFSKFFGKERSQTDGATRSRNRPEEIANRLQKEGRIADLESELLKLQEAGLGSNEREAWNHLYGIAAFQRNDHIGAFERFRRGHAEFPDSGLLGFSLGQEFEHLGKPERTFELFDRFRFPAIQPMYALATARYAYLWAEPDRGIRYLEPLIELYYKIGIADDHFLFMRGLPFFGETWAYLALFYVLAGQSEKVVQLTETASSRLSDFDFDFLRLEANWIATGNAFQLIAKLQEQASHARANKWPSGYSEMRAAVLIGLQSADLDEAKRVINAVAVSANDFKWLEDIRLLANCELAQRRRDTREEKRLVDEFFRRQPLLFEPSHALNFGLWKYQEFLKCTYQERKKQGNS